MAFCIREAAILTAYIWDMISFWLTRGLQSVSSYSAHLAQPWKYKPCAKSYADICLQYSNPIWLQLEMLGVHKSMKTFTPTSKPNDFWSDLHMVLGSLGPFAISAVLRWFTTAKELIPNVQLAL